MAGVTTDVWDPWAGIPEHYNLGVALTRGQVDRGLGNKPAIYWENAAGGSWKLTYAQLDEQSNRLASSLNRLGVKRGDRVFLRLPNRPEFYIAALASAKIGAVFIPSSTQFREAEVRYRLQDAGVVASISTGALASVIDRVRSDCPALQHDIVISEPGFPVGEYREDFAELLADGGPQLETIETQSDDIAFIAYTSGTTGDPKGVVHLHRYAIAHEALIKHWHNYQPDDIVACPSELGWLLPVASTFLFALSRGLTVVLYDAQGGRFDAVKWFGLIEKYRITSFTAPPTTYRMLMSAADEAKRFNLSSWRHGVSAGEPLPGDTFQAIRKHFGVTVLDGIGMSECYVYCYNRVGMPLKPGSCGVPGSGSLIEVMDDDLNPLPAGKEGVLCVRRDSQPGMMKEYWNKPERTAEILRGHWYYSGDVVVRDEDGYFWFKGRNDDVIKASGYRISPFEVESCLVSHPAVLEAAAVESPDLLRGNVVKAFLVLRPEFTASEELKKEIENFCRCQMAGYKHPRKIEFVASLPKTTSGKIKRRELRAREMSQ